MLEVRYLKNRLVTWAGILLCISVLVSCASIPHRADADILRQLSFHGSLKTSGGSAVTDGSYDIVFKIYDASSGGNLLWTGTHTAGNGNAVAVDNGFFSVLLGSGTGNDLDLSFNEDTYYLGVTVASDSEMTPRTRIGAAAFALNADKLDGYDASDFVRTDATSTIATSSADTLLTLNQEGAGDVLNAQVNGSEVFTITQSGSVGVGTSSPGGTLSVSGNLWIDNLANSTYSVVGTPIVNTLLNPPTNGTDNFVAGIIGTTTSAIRAGSFVSVYNGGATGSANAQGLLAQASLGSLATGNLSLATSGGGLRNRFALDNSSVGYNVAQMSALTGLIQLTGTLASTTDASAFHAESPTINSGNLLTNFYGLWVRGGSVTGTLTNRYGIYIDNLVGGLNRYGIYQAGASDPNYFAGNIGIGTSSAAAKLSVAGDAYIGGSLTATGTVTFTSLTSGLLYADSAGLLSASTTLGASILDSGVLFATEVDTSSELAALLSDETGSGALVFAASPTFSGTIAGSALTLGSNLTLSTIAGCTGGQALQTDGSGSVSCGTISVGGTSSAGGWTTSLGNITLSTTTDRVAIGASSTPYAKLSILSGSTATTTLALVPASGQTANIIDIYNTSGVLSSVFTADGKLGIGTTSLAARLAVGGDAYIAGDLTATGTVTLTSLTNGLLYTNGSGVVSASTTLGAAILDGGVIFASEIDTLAELETLQGGINILQSTEVDTSSEVAGIVTDETGSGALVFSNAPTFTGVTNLASFIATGSSTIGGGTQDSGLTINGGATTTGNLYVEGDMQIGPCCVSTPTHYRLTFGAWDAVGYPQILFNNPQAYFMGQGVSTDGSIVFGKVAGDNSWESQDVVITQDTGAVGIGTTSPMARLSVAGDAYLGGNVTATGTVTLTSLTNGLLYTNGSGVVSASTTLGAAILDGGVIFASEIDTSAELAAILGDESGSAGALVFSNAPTFTGTTLFSSLRATASSTIGGGTAQTGLTINGGATTTGNAYFAGNVGIGSTSPSGMLDIFGNGRNADLTLKTSHVAFDPAMTFSNSTYTFRWILNSGYMRLTDQNSLNYYRVSTTSVHTFYSPANTATMVISSGAVGIGTTSPWKTLSIAGDLSITGALFASNGSAGTSGMVLQTTGTGVQWVATSSLGFLTSSAIDTSAELAAILGDETGTGNAVFSASPTLSGTLNAAAATFSSTLTLSGSAANVVLGSNYLSGDGGDEGVFVDSTGNVGIGTTTPAGAFDVWGSGGRYATFNSNGRVVISANDNNVYASNLTLQNTYDGGYGTAILFNLGYGGTANAVGTAVLGARVGVLPDQAWTSTASTQDSALTFASTLNGTLTEQMRITSAGAVGIGTTTPATKLGVAGSAYIGGNLTATGTITLPALTSGILYANASGVVSASTTLGAAILDSGVLFATEIDTSSELAAILGDETGTAGSVVFSASPTLTGVATLANASTSVLSVSSNTYFPGSGIWNSSGYVGIGTTTPEADLTIQSSAVVSALFYRNTINTMNEFRTTGGSVYIGMGTFGFSVDDDTNLSSLPILSVSINATSTGFATGTIIARTMAGVDSPGVIRFARQDSDLRFNEIVSQVSTAQENNFIDFVLHNPGGGSTATTSVMRILGDGNVGIGTTTPDAKFQIMDTLTGLSTGLKISPYHTIGVVAGTALQAVDADPTSYRILALNPSGGNVGIGTTTPDRKLVIDSGSSATDVYFGLGNNGTRWLIGSEVSPTTDTLTFYDVNSTAARMAIDDNGNVGIGTTTPTAQLSTTGSVRFSNFGAGTLQTDASGNVSVSSDERLKDIEGVFTKGLEEIIAIEPVNFTWKDGTGFDTANIYTGFSAQNVQEAIPEAIGEDPHGYLTLSERPILAAVINAIKELYTHLTTQDDRIELLEAQVEELRNEVEDLRNEPDDKDAGGDSGETTDDDEEVPPEESITPDEGGDSGGEAAEGSDGEVTPDEGGASGDEAPAPVE